MKSGKRNKQSRTTPRQYRRKNAILISFSAGVSGNNMLCGAVNALPTIANTPETARDTSKTPARENFDARPRPAPLTSERVRHALRTSTNIPVRKARCKNRNGSANYPPQAPKTRQKSRATNRPDTPQHLGVDFAPFLCFHKKLCRIFYKK